MSKSRMEDVVCIEETAITVRGYRRRTTVPSKIFKFMELSEESALRWIAMRDGTVYVTKVEHVKTKDR